MSINDIQTILNAAEIESPPPEANESLSNEWPEPQPLTAKVKPEPYPVDALPDTIRKAVEEVVGFVKAPLPMVASSALAALSLATQAHIDSKRAERLHGPVGLFILTIADSGERKSTCDGFFTKAIREYEQKQKEMAKPVLQQYQVNLKSWEAKQSGVKDKIRNLAREEKSTQAIDANLETLEKQKPKHPRIPRLLYADATPEALAHGLAEQWPSAGIFSSEAGTVFGSHSMTKDSIMRNLSLLNQLWDGVDVRFDRREKDKSFMVCGARLTVGLQVQEPTLREFFKKSGELARGTGFLARFLIAWPESTQGYRTFTEAPENWPELEAFNKRLSEILNRDVPINDEGSLTPIMLSLTPEAKEDWVRYHDTIEAMLTSGGELYDVRDVASKSADNAARLAALFHWFVEDTSDAVSLEAFESASRIAAWHLNEARRFFGELALPAEMVDALRVDRWLIDYCKREQMQSIKKNDLRQCGPVRNCARLDAAIKELSEFERLRIDKEVRPQIIFINPALLEATK